MIHNHPSGILEPSLPDLEVAARLHEEGLGSAIVDNGVQRIYVVVEPPIPRTRTLLDPEEIEGLLAPGGALSRIGPGFEDREGQRRMARAVSDRWNEGGVLLVEAGTGTGKSLAYLLPAALWALRNGERVVISTATLNLQAQIAGKDLPLARRILETGGIGGDGLTWSVLKGRGNYVSIRRARLAAASRDSLFTTDRSRELDALLRWIDTTTDGSRSDLAAPPDEELWEEVRSDPDVCLRAKCPHFQACFYQRARREAAAADLLVVNHALLFTDLAVRGTAGNRTAAAVLPPWKHVVLDEAHHVEEAATNHMGARITRSGLQRLLSRIDRGGKGVLGSIQAEVEAGDPADPLRPDLLRRLDGSVHPAHAAARGRVDRFLDRVHEWAAHGEGAPLRLGSPSAPAEPWEEEAFREATEETLEALARLERELAALRSRIEDAEGWSERLEGRVLDLQALERRLRQAGDAIRIVLDPSRGQGAVVRWIEGGRPGRRGDPNVVLAAAPLEPGELLRESLFEPSETVILTSATMTTRGNFGFLRERLSLGTPVHPGIATDARPPRRPGPADAGWAGDDAEWAGADAGWVGEDAGWAGEDAGPELPDSAPPRFPVVEWIVPSPFAYDRQSILVVPEGLPDLRDPGFDRATAAIVDRLSGLTGGGIFVLFTSHGALRRTAAELVGRGIEGRHPLLVQGAGDRARLLSAFREHGDAILLGTSSFWEGVDVPGDPLRALVIQKLPFPVPTEPIIEARLERIAARGRNPFWDFMLPLAGLRLRQGFGRLVRTRTDRGAVLLLDHRLHSRRYGRALLDSLPDTPVLRGEWERIRPGLAEFYARAPEAPILEG